MTQEILEEAIKLKTRIEELELAKKNIKNACIAYCKQGSEYIYKPLEMFLTKHDALIRLEIDEEITRLKKEIELL